MQSRSFSVRKSLAVASSARACAPSRGTPCPRLAVGQVADEQRALALGRRSLASKRRCFRCSASIDIGDFQIRSRHRTASSSDRRPGGYTCPGRSLQTAIRCDSAAGGARCCVLAKVGEASLKGRNRRQFLDALRRNLKAALAGRRRARRERRVGAGDRGAGRARRGRGRLAAGAGVRIRRRLGLPALRARRRAHRRRRDGRLRAARSRETSPCACAGATRPSRSPRRSSSARSAPRMQAAHGLPVDLRHPGLELRVELDADAAYVHVREIDGRRRAAGGDERARDLAAVRRHRLAGRVAAGDEARAGGRLRSTSAASPTWSRSRPTKAQAQAKVLNGFQAERPGAMWVVPFGNQQRMLSAVSRGVASDRALPAPDGAHRLCAGRAAAGRRARHRRLAGPGLVADASRT